MLPHQPPEIQCRPLWDADQDEVADLPCEGFQERSRKYWTSGLAGATSPSKKQ
jgi:hypothetical protein